jgi:hypothetical protein
VDDHASVAEELNGIVVEELPLHVMLAVTGSFVYVIVTFILPPEGTVTVLDGETFGALYPEGVNVSNQY